DDFIRAHQPPICHFDTNEVVTLNIPNSESFEEAKQAYNSQPVDSTSTTVDDREAQDDFIRAHQPQICHFDTSEVVTLNIPSSEPDEETEQEYNFQPVDPGDATSMMELHNSFNGEKAPAEPISTPAESYIWRSQGEESDQYDNLHHLEAEGKNEPLQTAAATLISEPDSEQDEKSALSKNESVASDDYLEQFETYRRLKFSGSYEEETANFPHQQIMPAASLDEDYKEISPVPQEEIDMGMSPASETELEIVGERNTNSDLDLMKDDIVPPETHFFQSDHSNSELNVVPSDPLNCKVDLSQSGAVELSMDAVAEEE
uniref:Uncharacterized protein n=1 Tax=Plectus sambesii TaxID=2011161 RepID=A0A914V961_9BILA